MCECTAEASWSAWEKAPSQTPVGRAGPQTEERSYSGGVLRFKTITGEKWATKRPILVRSLRNSLNETVNR